MNTLTCPLSLFERLLRALAEDRNHLAVARVGVSRVPPDRGWLVQEVLPLPPDPSAPLQEPLFRLALASNPLPPPLASLYPPVVGHLAVGDGPWRGYLWGVVRTEDGPEPLHRLSLVGAGMHSIQLLTPHDQDPTPALFSHLSVPPHVRWSRTIGALGGEAIWQRLVRQSIAVVGCGRTGSLVAVTLARLGIQRLTLIDPDLLEPHNLGEMDAVSDADLGRPKAEALAECLRHQCPGVLGSPTAVVAPIARPAAIMAAKRCDVLFCCADNDAARLTTALLATLHHKVMVDIGTGIFHHADVVGGQGRTSALSSSQRTMGADIRLVLPGDGCLLCRGNLANYAQALGDLCNPRSLDGLRGDWRRQRSGSLRTVNQLAAAVAVHLLQELIAERIGRSVWAHVEFDEAGRFTVHYPSTQYPPNLSSCALCAKAGLGDVGLGL